MGLTLVEKIAARHADGLAPGAVVRSGDFISIRPRHVMTHDNTGAVIPKFKQIGATSIADPAQPVFAIDHDIQNTSPENLAKYAKIEAFAREHGIDFYPAGTGISHQVMVEQGYVVPGAMVVASDSHSNLYGGAPACLSSPVQTDPENAARRVAPVTLMPTSKRGGKIATRSARIPTRNTRSSLSSILRLSSRTCPGLTK